MNITKGDEKNFVLMTLSTLAAIAIIAFVCTLIPFFVSDSLDVEAIEKIFSVPIDLFHPENIERTRYVVSSLIIFPVLFFIVLLISKNNLSKVERIYPLMSFFVFIAFVALFFCAMTNAGWLYFANNTNWLKYVLQFTVLLVFLLKLEISTGSNVVSAIKLAMTSVCIALILVVLFTCTFSSNNQAAVRDHFSAFFYSAVQVYLGKILLIDFVNQYGYYPYILKPIMLLVGFSVLKFTAIMGLLAAWSYGCVFFVVQKLIKNKVISFLCFLNIVYFSYFFRLFIIQPQDVIFQIIPTRIIFPMTLLLIALVYFTCQSHKKWFYYFNFTVLSVGIFYNFDSGLVAFIAWILVLIYQELLVQDSLKHATQAIIGHVLHGVCFLGLGIYSLYFLTYLLSGQWPDLNVIYGYQKYFYIYGYFMIPMKLIHPWNFIAIVYALGMCRSMIVLITNWPSRGLEKKNIIKEKMIFLISVLGVGVFSYFQGRSHDHGILFISWPAIILLSIVLDEIFGKFINIYAGTDFCLYRSHMLRHIGVALLFLVSIFLLVAAVNGMYEKKSNIYELVRSNWSSMTTMSSTTITRNIEFIKLNTVRHENVYIASMRSGLYHLESMTTNPLKIPGPNEIFLKKDVDTIKESLKNIELTKVFYDVDYTDYKLLDELVKRYHIVKVSPDSSIVLFSPDDTIDGSPHNSKPSILDNDDKDCLLYFNNDILSLSGRRGDNSDHAISFTKSDFTIEFIIKPFDTQPRHATILSNHFGEKFQGFSVEKSSDDPYTFAFGYGNGKSWLPGLAFRLDKNFNYVAICVKNGKITIYQNGIPIKSREVGEGMTNSTTPIIVGDWFARDRPFNGEIKELRIIDRCIDVSEIITTYKLFNESSNDK